MNPTRHLKVHAVIIALLLLVGGRPAAALEAGAAKIRLTLPEGTPLGGDPSRMGRAALSEHDPLWARCVYLDDGENNVYLLSMDMHHIPRSLRDRILALAEGMLTAENLIITATHTGNGPGGLEPGLAMRWAEGRFQPELQESVAETVVTLLGQARSAAQRATLGYGTARQQVLSANTHDPAGPIDEQIGVVRIDNADGQAIAILSSFSAMPRMVPDENVYEFSADYPGAYYTALENLSDPGCIAMFLPGACGGQRTANPENHSGWAEVESVGRLLAVRTKEVANKMSYRDVKLNVFYREVPVPPTLAEGYFPPATILQALVLDDLVLLFLPGMPSADVGIELRSRLGALGYAPQIVVGTSNDYLMNFVSRTGFSRNSPEAARHHFGPGMADWLYDQAQALLRGSEVDGQPEETEDAGAKATDADGALRLAGPGFNRGRQRGQQFAGVMNTAFNENVVGPIREGVIRPDGDAWSEWPSMLDPTRFALPSLATTARPWLKGLDNDILLEVEGAASGAGLPFDALWLLQNAHSMATSPAEPSWFRAPVGTAVAALGDSAGADVALLGINLDWPRPDQVVVTTVKPAEGHRFVQIGFDWQLGAMAGMNDAGVAVAVLETGIRGETRPAGLGVEMAVREILQRSATFETAAARLWELAGEHAGRVLLSGPGEKSRQTAVINLGKTATVRTVESGLLLGVDLTRDGLSELTRERYQVLESELGDEHIVGLEEVKRSLLVADVGDGDRRRPWNGATRASIVMVPESFVLHVALPDSGGEAQAFKTFKVERGGANE